MEHASNITLELPRIQHEIKSPATAAGSRTSQTLRKSPSKPVGSPLGHLQIFPVIRPAESATVPPGYSNRASRTGCRPVPLWRRCSSSFRRRRRGTAILPSIRPRTYSAWRASPQSSHAHGPGECRSRSAHRHAVAPRFQCAAPGPFESTPLGDGGRATRPESFRGVARHPSPAECARNRRFPMQQHAHGSAPSAIQPVCRSSDASGAPDDPSPA